MLEKVWDKGEAYYKGYMLGVIIAEYLGLIRKKTEQQ